MGSRFQSPLHRGALFNERERRCAAWAKRYFSPLFIGEPSSTAAGDDDVNKTYLFQSPLHRGALFNLYTPAQAIDLYSISVPSSSGSPLQPSQHQYSNHVTRFQSPLHRGALFNGGRTGRAIDAMLFQSPLHRGALFNNRGGRRHGYVV